jgi:hypothetical protein
MVRPHRSATTIVTISCPPTTVVTVRRALAQVDADAGACHPSSATAATARAAATGHTLDLVIVVLLGSRSGSP